MIVFFVFPKHARVLLNFLDKGRIFFKAFQLDFTLLVKNQKRKTSLAKKRNLDKNRIEYAHTVGKWKKKTII